MSETYYKFSTYFKNKGFKERVQKITVDAGFSCPNRDGKLSEDGCIYCNNEGFSPNTRKNFGSIEEQIAKGIKRANAKKFIVYFQAYTNTYAPLDELKKIYDSAKKFKDVIGISIATRPDCVNEDVVGLIASYTKDYEVWIEYGLQTIHKKTLKFINRGHLYDDFLRAVDITKKKKDIKICAHVITGLPFEDKGMIIETAKSIGVLRLDGVKIHPMHIIKGTRLEELYSAGTFKVLELDEYVDLAVSFLEHLWPDTVIQRITADCPKELLIAPSWILDKSTLLQQIEKKLSERDTCQGRLL